MIRYRTVLATLLFVVGTVASGGTMIVNNTGDSGAGSLRAAIQAAQSGTCSAPCDIVFNIAGTPGPGGVFTIAPLTSLEGLGSGSVAVVDGATQTAFSGDTNPAGPEIVISGDTACVVSQQCRGFYIGNGSVVRNLIFNGWTNRVSDPANGRGVAISVNSLGLIAAEVTDNYIGTDPTGMSAVSNDHGIDLRASGTLISGNLISGNIDFGIFGQRALTGSLNANTIVANYIGTNRNGNAPLPNGLGIQFIGSVQPTNNVIGQTLAGQGNLIAYNLAEGIRLNAGPGCNNTMRGNSIHSNGALGIADTGPGFPPLSPQCSVIRFPPQLETLSYNSGTGQTTVTGGFHGNAGVALTLDWYTNTEADPSGFGEGETYIATRNVTTDAGGHWSVQLPGDLRNSNLVATTTQSSFSNVIGSAADLRLAMAESHTNPVGPGTRLHYTITVDNLGPDEATNVVVIDNRPQGVDDFGYIAGPEWSCTNSIVEVRCVLLQPLPVGASRSFAIEGHVQAVDTTITNTATVTATEQDTNPANDSDSVTTTVRPFIADLFIEHQVKPQTAETGGLIPYELRMVNNGPDQDPVVNLHISLANGLVAESIFLVDGTINCTGTNPVNCTLGAIGSGQQRVVLLGLRAPATTGLVSHSVTVSGLRNDPDTGDNLSSADTRLTPKQGRRRSARK